MSSLISSFFDFSFLLSRCCFISSLIFVQQSGAVCLAGPSVDIPFIKNTLEKISIKPEISKRKLYKV